MTWGTWLPDPFFRLKINKMHRAKHGSDSEVYTKIGDYDNERFNSMFELYTVPPHTHMTFAEAVHMVHCNMDPWDPVRQVFSPFLCIGTLFCTSLLTSLNPTNSLAGLQYLNG